MIQVNAKELYNAVKAVKITEVSKLPVLNHVLIQATGEGLIITTAKLTDDGCKGTVKAVRYWGNGEHWETCAPMITNPKVNHDKNGYFTYREHTIKCYPLLDYLRIMSDCSDPLSLEFNPSIQILTIKAGSSTTTFKCLDAQEFPAVKEG